MFQAEKHFPNWIIRLFPLFFSAITIFLRALIGHCKLRFESKASFQNAREYEPSVCLVNNRFLSFLAIANGRYGNAWQFPRNEKLQQSATIIFNHAEFSAAYPKANLHTPLQRPFLFLFYGWKRTKSPIMPF